MAGLENMSLIPGNVGTAPIQNIGAYGVELKDVFLKCDAIEIATSKEVSFTQQQCDFGTEILFLKPAQRQICDY